VSIRLHYAPAYFARRASVLQYSRGARFFAVGASVPSAASTPCFPAMSLRLPVMPRHGEMAFSAGVAVGSDEMPEVRNAAAWRHDASTVRLFCSCRSRRDQCARSARGGDVAEFSPATEERRPRGLRREETPESFQAE